jgi:hypothetical protein
VVHARSGICFPSSPACQYTLPVKCLTPLPTPVLIVWLEQIFPVGMLLSSSSVVGRSAACHGTLSYEKLPQAPAACLPADILFDAPMFPPYSCWVLVVSRPIQIPQLSLSLPLAFCVGVLHPGDISAWAPPIGHDTTYACCALAMFGDLESGWCHLL